MPPVIPMAGTLHLAGGGNSTGFRGIGAQRHGYIHPGFQIRNSGFLPVDRYLGELVDRERLCGLVFRYGNRGRRDTCDLRLVLLGRRPPFLFRGPKSWIGGRDNKQPHQENSDERFFHNEFLAVFRSR